MTTFVSKPPLNIRETLSRLDRPVGTGGQQVLQSKTVREAQNVLGVGRKNLLLNSQFHINQRGENVASGVTISGVNNYFTVDRWNEYHNTGVSRKVTVTYNTKLPDGTICNSYKSEYVSGAASWLHPVQQIPFENWMYGQTFTVSTWVKTNIQGFHLRVCDTTSCYLIGNEIPSDGEWHYMTGQITFPDSGLNASAVTQWQPAFGSTAIQAGDYIEFALMQVEVGTAATPFEWRSYEEELPLCQRYYYRITNEFAQHQNLATGVVADADDVFAPFHLPVTMRNDPAVDISSASHFRITHVFGSGGSQTCSNLQLGYSGKEVPTLRATGNTGGLTAGDCRMIGFDVTAGSGGIECDAEVV